MKPAILEELAQKAGVSTTVMRKVIFHDTLLVPQKKIWQVHNALMDNGYGTFDFVLEPGKTASTINVVDEYQGTFAKHAQQVAADSGYTLHYYINNRRLVNHEYYETLIKLHPTGGIISLVSADPRDVAQTYLKAQRPCMIVDANPATLPDDIVCINPGSAQAAKNVVAHLYELGHRRIAIINGVLVSHAAMERYRGYQEALAHFGIPFDERYVKQGNWWEDVARQAARELMALPDPPTAIFCANDTMAYGAFIGIRESGKSIPQDVSIVGFDNMPITQTTTPMITTVNQPVSEMGRLAATIMKGILEGEEITRWYYEVETELVVRGTSAAPPR